MYILKHSFTITALVIILMFPAFFAQGYEYKISAGDKAILKSSYAKAKQGQIDLALKDATRASDKIVIKIIKWIGYTDGHAGGGFSEIVSFMEKNPDWPNMKILKNKAELSLTGNESAKDVIKYFTANPPVTGYGMWMLARAKTETGSGVKEAIALLKQAWQQGDFSRDTEENFLNDNRNILTPEDHYQRVDRLLWEGNEDGAKRLYPLLSANHKKIVHARLEIMKGNSSAIAKLPENLRNNPGIIYEQLKILNEKENYGRMYQILSAQNGKMPSQAKLWKIKNRLVRELLDENKIKEAYNIAKNHGNEAGGSDYPEAEWLAGWISLRYLNNPQEAYKHFYNMYNQVKYPVSLSRAAYWAGRAAESNRNADIAQNWYEVASEYTTSFYGQLAYFKVNGKSAKLPLPKNPEMGLLPENIKKVREMLMAAYAMEAIGQSGQAERFIKAAINSVNTPSEMAYIGEFGLKIGRTNFAVVAGKEALSKGVAIVSHGWPQTKHMPKSIGVEKPLALGVIRQESVFNPNVMSSAKAMGLMQLIPATASRMSKNLGIPYKQNNLLSNPTYNITLGSHYLDTLINQFDGSYILAIASYNAGPGNARKWIKKYNDPREMDNTYDVIDWLESIPFGETRNYVQRVLENIQVYRSELNSTITLEKDLMRGSGKSS